MSDLIATKNGSVANNSSHGLTFPTWSSWIDELFNRDIPSAFTSNFNSGITLPKVNIRENNDSYFVDMAVPGLKKSDFQINLDNQLLSISAEINENDDKQEDTHIRREFGYASFKRSFLLPETVKEETIKAVYKEGVLSIHLPKKEEAKQKPARSIKIS